MQSKRENVIELTILGILTKLEIYHNIKFIIEELCENNYMSYKYEITTYKLEYHEGIKNMVNIIEFYHSMHESYEKYTI